MLPVENGNLEYGLRIDAPTLSDITKEFRDRMVRSGEILTSPPRPTDDPEIYLDPENVPRENLRVTAMKNILGAALNSLPDNSIELPATGVKIDPTAVAGGLKEDFAKSGLGRLIENGVRPWEETPKTYTKYLRDLFENKPGEMQRKSPYYSATGQYIRDITGNPSSPMDMVNRLGKRQGSLPKRVEIFDVPSRYVHGSEPGLGGAYWPNQDKLHIYEQPSGPGLSRDDLLATTIGHELEHAKDFQSGRVPKILTVLDSLKEMSNDIPTRGWAREINASDLPRGPNMWKGLTDDRRDYLKMVGGANRFSDARKGNLYDLSKLERENPYAFNSLGSLGHFATINNFESDFALRDLAQRALLAGYDVNPELIQQYGLTLPEKKKTLEEFMKETVPQK